MVLVEWSGERRGWDGNVVIVRHGRVHGVATEMIPSFFCVHSLHACMHGVACTTTIT